MAILDNLEPRSVFNFFEILTNIPRESGNEKAVSDYVVSFAKKRDLEVYQDQVNNVIIKKQGTKGYEELPAVIIQGHLDMVCEKNMDTVFNFEKDHIRLTIKDDYIMADGTTLGADNGIAVAYALALLDSKDIPHPPLEVLLTTDEEVGMKGALELDTSILNGKYFINLDSEEEGELLVSCAGGLKAFIHLPIDFQETNNEKAFNIVIKGLKGGHSGMEIDKNRANSNKLLGRILHELSKHIDFDIFTLGGGLKDNAIPREAFAKIIIPNNQENKLKKIVLKMEKIFQNEYKTSDAGVKVLIKGEDSVLQVFSDEVKNKLIFLLFNIPNGVQTMSADIKGLVESSTNLGVIERENDYINLIFAVRSSIKSLKYYIRDQIKSFAHFINADFIETAEYPEWEYDPDSKLRELFVKTYEERYGEKPLVKALHAGLECGVFSEKIPDLDLISIGPDMFDVHTPEENLSISSTKRTWEFLLSVLKNMKNI
ncbi:MAG: aminoacyl-histidine dipeptidase [bacterium]